MNKNEPKSSLLTRISLFLFGESRPHLFDPRVGFIDLKIVRSTISIFGFAAFTSAGIILVCSDLEWDFTHKGFNFLFTEVLKVPLGILATIIPILVLFGATHRSHQTKTQIEASGDQNRFSNSLNHQTHFVNIIQEEFANSDLNDFAALKPITLYTRTYKAVSGELDSPNLSHFTELNYILESLYEGLAANERIATSLEKLDEVYSQLETNMGINILSRIERTTEEATDIILLSTPSMSDDLERVLKCIGVLQSVLRVLGFQDDLISMSPHVYALYENLLSQNWGIRSKDGSTIY